MSSWVGTVGKGWGEGGGMRSKVTGGLKVARTSEIRLGKDTDAKKESVGSPSHEGAKRLTT